MKNSDYWKSSLSLVKTMLILTKELVKEVLKHLPTKFVKLNKWDKTQACYQEKIIRTDKHRSVSFT